MRRASLLLPVLVVCGLAVLVLVVDLGARHPGALPSKFDVGEDYPVVLDLHCGYSGVSYLELGSELWVFSEGGSADSIFPSGVLRRLSADTAEFVAGWVSHPLVRVEERGTVACI
jgi:hypothetical protein